MVGLKRKPRRPKRDLHERNVHNAIIRARTKDEAQAAMEMVRVFMQHNPDNDLIPNESHLLTLILTAPDSATEPTGL